MKHLFSVGNNISLFFATLLFGSIATIFLFDKSSIAPYISPNDIPKIELNNFTIYQIDKDNLVVKLRAKNAKQFDKFEEFSDVTLERLSNEILDTITAPTAIRQKNIISFANGANNVRNGYNMFVENGFYDTDKNILNGKGFFNIKGDDNDIVGDDIYYNAQNATMRAKNINAIFTLQNKAKK